MLDAYAHSTQVTELYMYLIPVSGNGPPTASRGPLEVFQLTNAHRIEGILHGRKLPAHYRRHDRSDRELSMAMAAGAMPEGTSPPSSLRSPAPSLRSPGPHLHSPSPRPPFPFSPPLRSSFLAASIPSSEVSGVATVRGGSEGVRELLHAVKITDTAAMEGLNPRRGQGSSGTPEMGGQEASHGGETRPPPGSPGRRYVCALFSPVTEIDVQRSDNLLL
jgi:hypothetical protein